MRRILNQCSIASAIVFCLFVTFVNGAELVYKKIVVSDKFHAEGATFGDYNNDGKLDIASGHFWYEGGDFTKRHQIYEGEDFDPKGYSNNFGMFSYDINGDGWLDIIVCPHPGTTSYWYENPKGKDERWKKYEVSIELGNESQLFVDINKDGRPEIVFNRNGFFGFAEFDLSNPHDAWKFTSVSGDKPNKKYQRYFHGLGSGDVNGDGRIDLLEMDGWWEQPEDYKKTPWTFHPFKFSDAASHVLVFDVDGDELNDVVTTRHCHEYGFGWFKQVKKDGAITFEYNELIPREPSDDFVPKISQFHSMTAVDMNGDGIPDVVTGKRWWAHGPNNDKAPNDPAILMWWETKRDKATGKATLIPHIIDDASGVGTQVTTGDLNGDKIPDIIVGNKRGTFVFISVKP
ncbi:MAG: VCBS repeat-containing protein [Planctomycetaceae bacterium]|jgi:hypothetical protein|nr:VCBS repeat-containing protein [Planctomycetaceae bacterium]